jgi:DUF438 domain-containing protein
MTDRTTLIAFIESLKDPFVFADTGHVIRYMNRAAIANYDDGAALIGRSLFDCHNEKSRQVIEETLEAFHTGEEERLITVDDDKLIYMRVVRDEAGKVMGYYERYEPRGK